MPELVRIHSTKSLQATLPHYEAGRHIQASPRLADFVAERGIATWHEYITLEDGTYDLHPDIAPQDTPPGD